MTQGWYQGNAAEDSKGTRGWIVGHFIDPGDGVRCTNDVEIKWGVHPAGQTRPEWTADNQRTTVVILVYGHFSVNFTETTAMLSKQGDYVAWGPGIDHSWEAHEDSVVMTVRWPSAT